MARIESIAMVGEPLFFFEKNQSYDWAKSLSAQYHSAQPFPHIVIDDFLAIDFAERILENFPAKEK